MSKSKGFTLVELLIVIALIAVLAIALVATLNPIEQINKARDARYKNDASELLAALERYYATTQVYPWVDGATYTLEDEFGATAETVGVNGVGICLTNCSSADGILITSGELKPAFASKDQFSDTATYIDKLYVYKQQYSSGSTFVCFIPKAGTNRSVTKNPSLKLVNVYDGNSWVDPQGTVCDGDAALWTNEAESCYICVPE